MSHISEIRRDALDMLARREHSKLELQKKLIAKEFAIDAIQQVLSDLEREHLQSDERFTENFVIWRMNRGYGPLHIQAELRERGVNQELIDNYLFADKTQWLELAKNVRIKKYGTEMPASFPEKAKQMRYLQYKGFTIDTINQIFNG